MNSLPQRFVEDKALRDAAKAVVDADLAIVKTSFAEQGVGGLVRGKITGKIKRRISTGARDVLDQATAQASDHPGVLAVLVGAVILWFARAPLLEWLGFGDEGEP